MKALPDGSFRYSPRDLIAYLDGDFAAWCERMYAEGQRTNGARSAAAPAWGAQPDAQDEEMKLAATQGRRARAPLPRAAPHAVPRHGRVRPRRRRRRVPDAGGDGSPRARHLPGPSRRRRLGRLPRLPLSLRRRRRLRRPALHAVGHQARPLAPSPPFSSSSAPTPTCWRRCTAIVPPRSSSSSAAAKCAAFPPGTTSTTTGSSAARSPRSSPTGILPRRPEPGLDRSWGRWEKTAEGLLRESDHLSLVATITRGQVRRLEDAGIATMTALGGLRWRPPGAQGDGRRLPAPAGPGAAPDRVPRARPAAVGAAPARFPRAPARTRAAPAAVRRRRLLRHGRLSLRRAADWSTSSAP